MNGNYKLKATGFRRQVRYSLLTSRRSLRSWTRRNPDLVTASLAPMTALRGHILPNFSSFMHVRTPLVWLLAAIIGTAVAYAAILFRFSISVVQLPWLGTMSERVYENALTLSWPILILAPMAGGLLVGLILQYLMPGKRAQAVADVIEARVLHRCHIPLRTGLSSAFIAAVSLGSGASAGREGPVVHLGASLASSLQNLFDLPKHARRTLLGCGVAAAISASFNAPIAAVLFAHEVILAHYAVSAFVPITIASVIASVIARIHFGNFPAFQIPDHHIVSYWEFPAFALLGITCALVAIIFQFSIIFLDRFARTLTMPLWLRPVLGGLFVGIIALAYPQVLGVGYDVTDTAIRQIPTTPEADQPRIILLLSLLVAKMAATAITLASRFGGGVFSPALFLGAMTGGAFGLIAASIFPDLASSNGAYALIGMGAVAATVLGAPISTTLIVFELTSGYALTIALLLAVSIAHGLTQAIHGLSFFHWQLRDRGLVLDEGQHRHIVRSIRVSEFMTPVDDDEATEPVEMKEGMVWLSKDLVMETALRSFNETGQDRLPVLDTDQTPAKIIGWASHVAALSKLNEALMEAHEEEHK